MLFSMCLLNSAQQFTHTKKRTFNGNILFCKKYAEAHTYKIFYGGEEKGDYFFHLFIPPEKE